MYCQHCGTPLDDDAAFCPKCGNKVNAPNFSAQGEKDEFFREVPTATANQSYTQPSYGRTAAVTNTMAVVGFILSFFVSIAGLICSIVGYKQCNQTGEGGKGFAVAGIVISAVSIAIVFLAVVIVAATGSYYYYYY